MNQVSGAGNRQCIMVNKIGQVLEFIWLHSSEVGLWQKRIKNKSPKNKKKSPPKTTNQSVKILGYFRLHEIV